MIPTPTTSLPEIPASLFVWEKYISKVGFAVHEAFNDQFATPLVFNKDCHPIGWCKADQLRIRPRTEGYAVLAEMDGDEFWFHVLDIPQLNTSGTP